MNNIKLQFGKPTFTVAGNTIIAHLPCRLFQINGDKTKWKEFNGKAACSNNDKFDFNKGRLISIAKAETAAYKYVKKAYTEMYKNCVKTECIISDFFDKVKRIEEHNNNFIKEISK